MDEIMCGMQGDPETAQAARLGPVSVRLGVVSALMNGLDEKAETTVARIIEFYIPNSFQKNGKWIPPEQRGKVIEFPVAAKKSA